VHEIWKTGFQGLLETSSQISEQDLLDGDPYPWLRGYSLAFILIASYEHHQEHFEKLQRWLRQHGS
jgi:hypothetical protein